MNKTAIKNFAIWARVNLIESAKQKAYEYEITKDGANNKSLESVGGRLLTGAEKEQRRALIEEINEKGFEQVMEEAAYTWFNRFIALRFMEVNGYLPSRIRVFTNEEGEFKPEIMKEAMTVEIEGLDREKVFELLEKQNNEELYKYLLITQCNALGDGLPKMFEKISDWTELLFPANLLRADSVIGKMVSEIPEEDFTDAVQIIGWLYQYYNTELKDDTFAKLKKNIKISKERIPAATQLFTPDWIVRYMVENSLGRIYVNEKISSLGEMSETDRIEKEKAIAEEMGWRYYLPEAEQTPEVRAQLNSLMPNAYSLMPNANSLTTLKVIDPCMGSGHILVYAFDVLMQMYTASGWSERDAAKSIVERNLYGLDIDDRAGQLAYFAVMMKARKYNRRALAGGAAGVLPNVYAIQESNHISTMAIDDFCNRDAKVKTEMDKLLYQMRDAKEYGSILNIKDVNFDLLFTRCDECVDEIHFHQNEINEDIIPLIKIAYIMAQKYDVVVTNPPYMGGSGMSAKLGEFVKKNYPDSKSDLFAVFIERCAVMLKKNGYQAMITQHAWMFLSSYEKLREKLLTRDTVNMAHLGARAFEEIGGEVVQTTSFVIRNTYIRKYCAKYCRLIDGVSQYDKEALYLSHEYIYASCQEQFRIIPGKIYGYWISPIVLSHLSRNEKLSKYGKAKQGLATTDNKLYLRLWQEVKFEAIDFECPNCEATIERMKKWYPYNKAGNYRKWSSINEYVVNYQNDGMEIKASVMKKYPYLNNPGFVVKNTDSYFMQGITWNDVSTGNFCCRFVPKGFIYDAAGPMFFSDKDYLMMGYFNSVVFQIFANIICQGLHYSTGHIPEFPYVDYDDENKKQVKELVEQNLRLSTDDWDSFETSWDFKKHPLV